MTFLISSLFPSSQEPPKLMKLRQYKEQESS
jgi:hypothetical protein